LKGLLLSESRDSQEVGRKFFRAAQKRYSSEQNGLLLFKEIERELAHDGISVTESDPQAVDVGMVRASPVSVSGAEVKERLAPLEPPLSDSEVLRTPKNPKLMWLALVAFLITATLAFRARMR
jgi:hypothetical protein